jgi:hypothetical protein
MISLIIRIFKPEVLIILALHSIDAIIMLGISILILYLFNAVSSNNIQEAYAYAGAVVGAWYIDQLARQICFVKSFILYARIRSAFGMLLYAKVSSLNGCMSKNSETGKITNLIASDLGTI